MEPLLAATWVGRAYLHTTAVWSSSASRSSTPFAIGTGGAGASTAVRTARCTFSKDAIQYALEQQELFNSLEVVQWESGMSFDSIAAAQGIRVRRRRCPNYHDHPDSAAPQSLLERIIWDKEVEVSQSMARTPLEEVAESARHAPPPRDFVAAMLDADASCRRNSAPALVAEVKTASPFDPVDIARAYEKKGAACLSILTDEKHFQGSFENLETVRKSGVKCPLLCMDFVIDIWQIYYARSKGADAILIMAAVLPDLDIKYMLRICKDLGMAALIEVHDERELDRMLKIDGVQLIAVNNRNIERFKVDTANTKMLLETRGDIIRKKGILVVGKCGFFIDEDVAYVHNARVSTVLIEEALVAQEESEQTITGLFGKDLLN